MNPLSGHCQSSLSLEAVITENTPQTQFGGGNR